MTRTNFFAQFSLGDFTDQESPAPRLTADQTAEVERAEYEHRLRALGYSQDQFPHNRPEKEDWSVA